LLFSYLFRYTEDTEGFTEKRESTKSNYSFSLSVLCANSAISVSSLNYLITKILYKQSEFSNHLRVL